MELPVLQKLIRHQLFSDKLRVLTQPYPELQGARYEGSMSSLRLGDYDQTCGATKMTMTKQAHIAGFRNLRSSNNGYRSLGL